MSAKVALVTGGGRGIGKSIALTLAENGYDLAVNYSNSAEGALAVCEQIQALGRRAVPFKANLARVDEIAAMFDEFGKTFDRLDLLVNNAGITRCQPLLETTEELFDTVTAVDWKGAFFCTQHAARFMIDRSIPGRIINITSNQQQGCWPNYSVYGSTKAALLKFTKHAALELARYDIRVNAIAPGFTVDNPDPNRAEQGIPSRIPLKRFGSSRNVANAVVYLAGESASYITGTCLTIDGGALLPVVVEHDF